MHAAAANMEGPFDKSLPLSHVPNSKLVMWLFLGSDAMGFTGLLGAYTVFRLSAGAKWVPNGADGQPLSLDWKLTTLNTVILICSSVTMVLGLGAVKRGDLKRLSLFVGLTAVGGLAFLSLQAVEWTKMIHEGITAPSSLFGATFFTLTGFHGFHVFIGVVLLVGTFFRSLRGRYTQGSHNTIEVVGLYWHFVDLVWIILFTLIYLLDVRA